MFEIFPNPKLFSVLFNQLFLATFFSALRPFLCHSFVSHRSFGSTCGRAASKALIKRSSKPSRFKEAGYVESGELIFQPTNGSPDSALQSVHDDLVSSRH
jgi:hypothetical protein